MLGLGVGGQPPMGVPQMGNAMNTHPMTPHMQVNFIVPSFANSSD